VNPADIPFQSLPRYSSLETVERSRSFYEFMRTRRSIRRFSEHPIPEEAVKNCILTAGTAPSGANQQPWTFVLVKDRAVKRMIREEAERIEHSFYTESATETWREALKPLGTDCRKPFLERAPYLIVIFVQKYGRAGDGSKIGHYYAQKSVGIATGLLVAALHDIGVSSLVYTPANMAFLNSILHRPCREMPYLVLAVGYAHEDARVPAVGRKSFEKIAAVV
jgi:nitroreductase